MTVSSFTNVLNFLVLTCYGYPHGWPRTANFQPVAIVPLREARRILTMTPHSLPLAPPASASRVHVLLFLVGLCASATFAVHGGPVCKDHSDLTVYPTADGKCDTPVQTPADWAIRRADIIKGFEAVRSISNLHAHCLAACVYRRTPKDVFTPSGLDPIANWFWLVLCGVRSHALSYSHAVLVRSRGPCHRVRRVRVPT